MWTACSKPPREDSQFFALQLRSILDHLASLLSTVGEGHRSVSRRHLPTPPRLRCRGHTICPSTGGGKAISQKVSWLRAGVARPHPLCRWTGSDTRPRTVRTQGGYCASTRMAIQKGSCTSPNGSVTHGSHSMSGCPLYPPFAQTTESGFFMSMCTGGIVSLQSTKSADGTKTGWCTERIKRSASPSRHRFAMLCTGMLRPVGARTANVLAGYASRLLQFSPTFLIILFATPKRVCALVTPCGPMQSRR